MLGVDDVEHVAAQQAGNGRAAQGGGHGVIVGEGIHGIGVIFQERVGLSRVLGGGGHVPQTHVVAEVILFQEMLGIDPQHVGAGDGHTAGDQH